MAFGNIEHAAVSLVRNCTSRPDCAEGYGNRAAGMKLARRLAMLDALMREPGVAAEIASRWRNAFGEVERLRREYRNAVAHGAPVVSIYEIEDSGEVVFEFVQSTPDKPNRRAALKEIQRAAEDAEGAHVEFAAAGVAVLSDLAARGVCPLTPPEEFLIDRPAKASSCGSAVAPEQELDE
jgi:hypothetical protein